MILEYFERLDALITASTAITDINIIRRDIRDTGLEKIALYRYRLNLIDESIVEITERLVEEKKKFV